MSLLWIPNFSIYKNSPLVKILNSEEAGQGIQMKKIIWSHVFQIQLTIRSTAQISQYLQYIQSSANNHQSLSIYFSDNCARIIAVWNKDELAALHCFRSKAFKTTTMRTNFFPHKNAIKKNNHVWNKYKHIYIHTRLLIKKESIHHGHGNLLEVILDIPHVGEGLSTEYDSKPRA